MATNREKAKQRQQQNGSQKGDYQEQPGWASAWHRPDNDYDAGQPYATGDGLDQFGDPIQVAVWLKTSKNGTRYFRVHIEPPYQEGGNDNGADSDSDDPGEGLPF